LRARSFDAFLAGAITAVLLLNIPVRNVGKKGTAGAAAA
jgi:hypothetical protein